MTLSCAVEVQTIASPHEPGVTLEGKRLRMRLSELILGSGARNLISLCRKYRSNKALQFNSPPELFEKL